MMAWAKNESNWDASYAHRVQQSSSGMPADGVGRCWPRSVSEQPHNSRISNGCLTDAGSAEMRSRPQVVTDDSPELPSGATVVYAGFAIGAVILVGLICAVNWLSSLVTK